MTKPPLDGVRVLDLSSVVVGPFATQFLAEYGASVTKIEALEGDILRRLGGPSKSGELSPKFMHLNRNKRSLAIDLKNEQAADVLHKLMESHDVFLSNVRPSALARLGLDYASYRKKGPMRFIAVSSDSARTAPTRASPLTTTSSRAPAALPHATTGKAANRNTCRWLSPTA